MAANGRQLIGIHDRESMNNKETEYPSEYEKSFVEALSRDGTVAAYAEWMQLSVLEEEYLMQFINSEAKVLDLGCGTGRIPKVFRDRMKLYLGVDCSEPMIESARQINPGIEFRCEDFLANDYGVDRFNVVLLMNNVIDMLHPINRRKRTFEFVRETLVESGVMVCSSHLLDGAQTPGYFEENYHGATVRVYRSTFGQFCDEVESHGMQVEAAARDYRHNYKCADWAYLVASKKSKDRVD
jgi:SAM-dependent methyltransferase